MQALQASQANLQKIKKPSEHHVLARSLPKAAQKVWNFMWAKHQKNRQIKYTKQQIADWCMISRSSVTRALRILEREGIIYTQHFIEAPLYNEPNRYFLEDAFTTPDVMEWCAEFFKHMCKFAVFALLSMSPLDASGEDNTPLILKRNYGIDIEAVRRVREKPSFRSFFKDSQLVGQYQGASLAMGCLPLDLREPAQQGIPKNNNRTGEVMQSDLFTHDQLVELAKYPQEVLHHAIGTLAGKTIDNPFTWVRKICELELAKRRDNEAQPSFAQSNQKFPSRGKSGASFGDAKSSTVPRSQVQAQQQRQNERYQQFLDLRKQKRYDRLVALGYTPEEMHPWQQTEVLSHDRLSYYTGEDCSKKGIGTQIASAPVCLPPEIRHVETTEEFVLNYEKFIHARTERDPEFAKKCSLFDRNPLWDKLNVAQKATIWTEAHGVSCNCRKNEQAGIILPEIAAKLLKPQEQESWKTGPELIDDDQVWEEVN